MEFVSVEEVESVCAKIGIPSWAAGTPVVTTEEVTKIMKFMEIAGSIPVEDLQDGIEVELEHGVLGGDANITNNHPIMTAMIAIAHINESADYYDALEKMEEGLEKEEQFLALQEALETRDVQTMLTAIQLFETKYEEED